jgi:hypothetical protein
MSLRELKQKVNSLLDWLEKDVKELRASKGSQNSRHSSLQFLFDGIGNFDVIRRGLGSARGMVSDGGGEGVGESDWAQSGGGDSGI